MTTRVHALKPEEWPVSDREAWERACRPPLRLRAGGAAGHLKASTRLILARAYGYLLDFCKRAGLLDMNRAAAGQVTEEITAAFLAELSGRVGSVTRAILFGRIARIAELLHPGADYGWLRELASELRLNARPRPKQHRIVDSRRLLVLGLALIDRAECSPGMTNLRRARLFRDGLMIALLSLCPIRLGNFSSLRIGDQIRRIDGSWWILLDASETKGKRPDERPIADFLTPHLDRWVGHWHGCFLNPGDALWPSVKGGMLAYSFVGKVITDVTRRELGVAISPHLFRDSAVHTIADSLGDQMGLASALLQHTDPRTTDLHYNKGASTTAAKRYVAIVTGLEAASDEQVAAGISILDFKRLAYE
jgi:integrase/recombinase XerD